MWRERYYEHAGVEATKGLELMNLYVALQTDSSTDSRQMVILRGQKVAVVQKYVSKHMSFGVFALEPPPSYKTFSCSSWRMIGTPQLIVRHFCLSSSLHIQGRCGP